MKFAVFIALVGAASAARYNNCGCAQPPQEKPQAQEYNCDDQVALQANSLRGALDASAAIPQPGAGGCDGYGVLSSESAASRTCIGAAQVAIPDKNIITDQAKVQEAVSRGSRKSQTCQVAQRKFSIAGDITVTEKYNDNLKGDNTSESCGKGASQIRSRTQLISAGAKAKIPVTTTCAQPAPPCSQPPVSAPPAFCSQPGY